MPFSPSIFNVVSPVAILGYLSISYFVAKGRIARQHRAYEAQQAQYVREAQTALVPKALLTANEKEFFSRLERAASALSLAVVPQVSMGALLDVNLPESHPYYWTIRKQFSQKIIDFVVYSKPSMDVLAVVELDDRTHDVEKDKQRDAMMAQAGFRTIRWDSRAKPSVSEIVAQFEKLQESRSWM